VLQITENPVIQKKVPGILDKRASVYPVAKPTAYTAEFVVGYVTVAAVGYVTAAAVGYVAATGVGYVAAAAVGYVTATAVLLLQQERDRSPSPSPSPCTPPLDLATLHQQVDCNEPLRSLGNWSFAHRQPVSVQVGPCFNILSYAK
jgi:hypothetical protein